MSVAVAVGPAGILSFEGLLSEKSPKAGNGGMERVVHALLVLLRPVRGGMVEVVTECALAVFVVFLREKDVDVPHLVHVPRRNDLLILEDAQFQEALVPLLS